jgi:uncharacterized repeat protein (TIGR03809 family)
MSETPSSHLDLEVSRKWRVLAEQRHAHLVELYLTGRWKQYYDEQDFVARMREAIHLMEMWSAIAPAAAEEKPASGA